MWGWWHDYHPCQWILFCQDRGLGYGKPQEESLIPEKSQLKIRTKCIWQHICNDAVLKKYMFYALGSRLKGAEWICTEYQRSDHISQAIILKWFDYIKRLNDYWRGK